MPSIEDLLGKLDKATREYAMSALDVHYEKQEVPSLKLQAALRGGFPYGRLHTIWGSKAAGKTAFALQLIGMAQKEGKSCAFIDAEKTFDPAWATRLGVNTEELVAVPVSSMNRVVNTVVDLCHNEFDIIVIDSITGLIPTTFYDKKTGELKDFEGTSAMSQLARDLSRALPIMVEANEDTMIILISQGRTMITSNSAFQAPSGGNALSYYSSNIIKLFSSPASDNTIEGLVYNGDRAFKKPIGRKVTFTIEHSKTSPPGYSDSYDFYYDGDFVGIDNLGEVIDLGVERGVIRQAGAWYSYGDEKWQGRQAVIDAVREDDELYEQLKKEALYDGEEHSEASEQE